MLNKLCKKISAKFILVFIGTIFSGIAINSFTGNYWFEFTVTESFTKSEAENLVSKRIFDTCLEKNEKVFGTITSHEIANYDKTRLIVIRYDKPIMEKFNNLRISKSVFNECTNLVQ